MHNGHGEKKSDGHVGDPFPTVEPRAKLTCLAVSRWCVHKSGRCGSRPVAWLCREKRQERMRAVAM